ncbi:MAG: PIN domain-containing protein [Chloroflexi bacterium]|jgi:predicted nucleic acid-binding protein|nr:PIN domain-containing protein [Chloroflexota bacterium]
MLKVFVDTAAWIALLNVDDELHEQAQEIISELRHRRVRLITTEFVLVEVADALSRPSMRSHTVIFIEGLRQMTLLRIIPVSQSLLIDGWDFYRRRPDKDWGLTDCTSFVVMTQEKISQAFTSDHDFEQAGFTKLMARH